MRLPTHISFALTGNTLAAQTNATGGGNFGINYLSISNSAFDTTTGAGGSESSNINFLETFTFVFDQDVTITEIDFASLGANESADITIGAITTSFVDGTPSDVFANPFGTLLITAGTNITLTGNGTWKPPTFGLIRSRSM